MIKDHHLSEEQIALCADAINSDNYEKLPEFIREHLVYCEQCVNEVMMVTEIFSAFEKEFPGTKKKARLFKIKPWHISTVSVAAAITLLFVVLQFTDLGNDKASKPDIVQIQQDRLTLIVDTNDTIYIDKEAKPQVFEQGEAPMLAEEDILEDPLYKDTAYELIAAYVPDKNLEQIFNNMKGTYRGRNINITTPHIILHSEQDSLKWSNPENEKLYVEIFNNNGEEIEIITSQDQGVAIPELTGGLYYWKLINEHFDLLFVGKIIVK